MQKQEFYEKVLYRLLERGYLLELKKLIPSRKLFRRIMKKIKQNK